MHELIGNCCPKASGLVDGLLEVDANTDINPCCYFSLMIKCGSIKHKSTLSSDGITLHLGQSLEGANVCVKPQNVRHYPLNSYLST